MEVLSYGTVRRTWTVVCRTKNNTSRGGSVTGSNPDVDASGISTASLFFPPPPPLD